VEITIGGTMKVRARLTAGLLAAGMLLAAGCGGGSGGSGGGSEKLTLVAYSTPREAYEQLIPEFQKTDAGKGVGFTQSYGASGDQSRAVQNGLAADVVTLALEPDMTKLEVMLRMRRGHQRPAGRAGLPAGQRSGHGQHRLPPAVGPVRHQGPGWLDRGEREVLRQGGRDRGRQRAPGGRVGW
jgi:Bacterial extracellular solute-binding protein